MSNEYEGFLFPKPKRQKKRKKHGKNVINTKAGVCFLCAMEGDHSIKPTERHHVLYGNGLREISEAQGWVVDLCHEHHRNAPYAVHNCRATREKLCRIIQLKFEETHTRAEWMELAGKNYLAGEIFQHFRGMQRGDFVKYKGEKGYSANYNDFGHNQNTERFFEQMDFLTPELYRVLEPGRVAAIHVKDRVLFGNATGTGMPTIEPFHAQCIDHYMKHGFQYFGMITVVTDVVRENNQTYRLGWSEQCKDGSKMGVGCPEYVLLFRKLPSDRSNAYADDPVKKSKEEYTRAQWQIDAHGYWRSSGDRLVSKEELKEISVANLQAVYRKYSRESIYSYEEHVKLAEDLDKDGKLPATFMVVAPGSWNDLEVWDDINRMRTLNTTQSRRRKQMHVCPLQLDIVERIINRYSNEGDLVYDPFGGLMTVPMMAVKMKRRGKGCELNADYFRDGVGYLQETEAEMETPTLFDFIQP